MSKIKENLVIILNLKDIKKRIEDLENKAALTGKTGVANQATASGDNNSSVDGSSVTNPKNSGVTGKGDTKADAEGIKPAEDVFDRIKIGDKLDQLTDIYDCETGRELSLSPNGKQVNYGDSAYLGWDLGKFWNVTGPYLTISVVAALEQAAESTIGYIDPTFEYIVTDYRGFTLTSTSGTVTGATYEVFLDWDDTDFPINTGWAEASLSGTQQNCSGEGEILCPSTAPQRELPEGEPIELIWKDGKIQSNPAQPDVPVEYQGSSRSELDFCFGEDLSRHGHFEAAADGGSLLYETDESGNIIEDALHLDANGVVNFTVKKEDLDKYQA